MKPSTHAEQSRNARAHARADAGPDASDDNGGNGRSARPVGRHSVRRALQRMILSGQRAPGSKLVQMQLARQLGCAQGVIREALLELQACGLVHSIDNRGMYVAKVTTAVVLDSYDLREMHEGLAARLCCERIPRSGLRELRSLVEGGHEAARRGEFHEMISCYRQFHHHIIQHSGSRMLARLADNYRFLGITPVGRDPAAVREEHEAILQAIELGDPDRAEAQTRAHVRALKRWAADFLRGQEASSVGPGASPSGPTPAPAAADAAQRATLAPTLGIKSCAW